MSQTRRRRAMRFLAVAVACAALPAATARASTNQLSVIEDEHQMLDLGPAAQAAALDDAKALGADVVRANVIWSHFAPKPRAKRKPRRFDGKNPAKYAAAKWAPLDGLVAGAQARGLKVLLTPTGPGPAWASRCKGSVKVRRTCKPDPHEFGAFVRALGRRYKTVTMWSIWNEPNLKAWLSPQYTPSGVQPRLQSAALYRSLARSAIAGLRGTGHRRHTILLGETAPIGNDVRTCRTGSRRARRACINRQNAEPVPFLRGLFCVNGGGRKLGGAEGRRQRCTHYSRLNATGYAHHPYTRGGSQPPLSKPNTNEITIGVSSRLTRILDAAAKRKRVPRRLPVWYTENGWQTNPPDRIFGVSPVDQAAYINQSDWIGYKNRRIRAVAQYKLIDDSDQASFQSGVRFTNGSPKPSYNAYRLPIWVSGAGSRLTVYGQVRTADDSATLDVEIQHAAGAGSSFQTVQTVTVHSRKGQFTAQVPNQPGVWRLRSGGLVSREAQAAPR